MTTDSTEAARERLCDICCRPHGEHGHRNECPETSYFRDMPETPDVSQLLRPIIGIENRTAQEVFDMMTDRIRYAFRMGSRA